MTLTAIGFDLWETLITDTPAISESQARIRLARMQEILIANGSRSAAAAIEHAYRELWNRCQELYWSEDRDIPCSRQIDHFLDELGLDRAAFSPRTLEELEHAYARAAVEVLPEVIDGAIDLLAELKRRGLRVGIISNTGRTPGYALREILQMVGITPYLDAMVFSNEHGVCKPQPSIFTELRQALGVEFEEMMFVGDNLYVDVLGAQRCGMRAVHFVPAVRGTAVAPPVAHEPPIAPDATITNLRQVLGLI